MSCSQTVPLYCLLCIDTIWANKMMMMMMMIMMIRKWVISYWWRLCRAKHYCLLRLRLQWTFSFRPTHFFWIAISVRISIRSSDSTPVCNNCCWENHKKSRKIPSLSAIRHPRLKTQSDFSISVPQWSSLQQIRKVLCSADCVVLGGG